MKLTLRCDAYFKVRDVLIVLFKQIDTRSKYLMELKNKVSPIDFELEESEDEDLLYDIGK